jgi:hypothetical protein
MFRYYCGLALLASAVLFAGAPAVPLPDAQGQMMYRQVRTGLAGTYINQATGNYCYVYNLGAGYLFASDYAERIQFMPVGSNLLRSVRNNPTVPDILVTVTQNAFGRIVLIFESPGMASGTWVSAT